jgi:hypothetical protein
LSASAAGSGGWDRARIRDTGLAKSLRKNAALLPAGCRLNRNPAKQRLTLISQS